MWTLGVFSIVKSQDILLLFKLASLHAQEENLYGAMESESNSNAVEGLLKPQQVNRMTAGARVSEPLATYPNDSEATVFRRQAFDSPLSDEDGWEGWSDPAPSPPLASWSEGYSLRALSASLGISKSEISNAISRCRESGLLISDYDTGLPKVNRRELLKITEHALKYFFPVKPGAMVRGIPTGFAAPALSKSISSAGELIPVWPDALGTERGQAIEPLYKTVPEAVKKDRTLYHFLALADAIRLGGPRECGVAIDILRAGMGLK
ncbi:MarR family transcriptional regulator [Pseudomonas hormoni]|uniref:MarR family transcriptional regulator n=1 Tax=Pseudomonas hormoni TaxID=3093767 RepID=A0ABX8F4D3_9PSED|nr:MarR family transcriptional regulator [Pseudomonas hormoni]QVW26784.1 MarR family transcriptional regulator [Pseudomonas hormoni]